MSLPLSLNSDNTPTFVSELLYQLKIRDVMTAGVITARRSDSLRSLQQTMKQSAITGMPVAEGRRLLGIVSMDDIIRALDNGTIDDAAELHMSRSVIVLEDDMPLAFGLSYMEKYRFGRFPVLNREGELVGIITSRDIIVHLLLAMNREVEQMEARLRADAPPAAEPAEGLHEEFGVRRFDFENAGKASAAIKARCKERGIDPRLTRRIAVASYELEMNQVIHSEGGTIRFEIKGDLARVTAADTGPGIADVSAALAEGWSTATEWVRSLGFGAGMGLPNTRRVADRFEISSATGSPTVVVAEFRLESTPV